MTRPTLHMQAIQLVFDLQMQVRDTSLEHAMLELKPGRTLYVSHNTDNKKMPYFEFKITHPTQGHLMETSWDNAVSSVVSMLIANRNAVS